MMCNSALASVVASTHIEKIANDFANDVLVVCTGKELVFYSRHDFDKNGRLVEVSPPSDGIDINNQSTTCYLSHAAEKWSDVFEPSCVMPARRIAFQQEVHTQYSASSLKSYFSPYAQRAPPVAAT
ncbi:MAG: hypothetical protein AAGJ37_14475 [Pseudomonadota bacterium]